MLMTWSNKAYSSGKKRYFVKFDEPDGDRTRPRGTFSHRHFSVMSIHPRVPPCFLTVLCSIVGVLTCLVIFVFESIRCSFIAEVADLVCVDWSSYSRSVAAVMMSMFRINKASGTDEREQGYTGVPTGAFSSMPSNESRKSLYILEHVNMIIVETRTGTTVRVGEHGGRRVALVPRRLRPVSFSRTSWQNLT